MIDNNTLLGKIKLAEKELYFNSPNSNIHQVVCEVIDEWKTLPDERAEYERRIEELESDMWHLENEKEELEEENEKLLKTLKIIERIVLAHPNSSIANMIKSTVRFP